MTSGSERQISRSRSISARVAAVRTFGGCFDTYVAFVCAAGARFTAGFFVAAARFVAVGFLVAAGLPFGLAVLAIARRYPAAAARGRRGAGSRAPAPRGPVATIASLRDN
jgi:hypothetical protein